MRYSSNIEPSNQQIHRLISNRRSMVNSDRSVYPGLIEVGLDYKHRRESELSNTIASKMQIKAVMKVNGLGIAANNDPKCLSGNRD